MSLLQQQLETMLRGAAEDLPVGSTNGFFRVQADA